MFSPSLSLISGKAINKLTEETFDGRNWQQWSRHRTRQNPWRSGLDDIGTHLALVNDWLKRELKVSV